MGAIAAANLSLILFPIIVIIVLWIGIKSDINNKKKKEIEQQYAENHEDQEFLRMDRDEE